MPPKKAAAARKPRAPKGGHQLAAPLPPGTTLTDFHKKQWVVGKPIGSGGFGLIYLASAADHKGEPQYVVKVEPLSNGPLFCELNFYQRAAKPEMVSSWMKEHKVKSLGMPKFIGAGMLDRSGVKYRFMIMERFGSDLQKLFEQNKKSFPHKTVLQLALRILDVLEYIHDQSFAHADIKAANLLLGNNRGAPNQVFLVDYGLAYRYMPDGVHKEYREDPKRCHDGTIEFTSRDAHKGVVPSRRGDLEILGYCLLQWLCSKLPWEDKLLNKEYVRDQKLKYMKDVPTLLKSCFPGRKPPEEMQQYLEYVNKLGYTDRPDYNKCRTIFKNAMKKQGFADDKLTFSGAASPVKKAPTKSRKRVSLSPSEDDDDDESDSETSPPPAKQRGRASGGKAPARGAARAKAKSPAATPKRVAKSPAARARAVKSTINGNVHGTPAKTIRGAPKKLPKEAIDVATQTSPGLRGLKRSWKK